MSNSHGDSGVDSTGTPRARVLAAALRQARCESGWGVREVARRLGLSHTTISQWENARRVPHPEDVSAMLAAIGLTGERRHTLLDLARGAADRNWLNAGMPGARMGLAGIVECERTATRITEWCPLTIPGLLQTPDYARAIMSAGRMLDRVEIETRLRIRFERRAVLDPDRYPRSPAHFVAMIGEWALRLPIGGTTVLIEQLRELLVLADHRNITLHVIPERTDWHPGLAGPFLVYDFAAGSSIIHLEQHRSCAFLYDEASVTEYRNATTWLHDMALPPEASLELIESVASTLAQEVATCDERRVGPGEVTFQ